MYWHVNSESIYVLLWTTLQHQKLRSTFQHLNWAVIGYLKYNWGNQLIGWNNQTVFAMWGLQIGTKKSILMTWLNQAHSCYNPWLWQTDMG